MKDMVEEILSGRKRLTNRASTDFRNKLEEGGTMHLFTGMRTANCRKIGDALVKRIRHWHPDWIPGQWGIDKACPMFPTLTWRQFAKLDGFDDFREFNKYFQKKMYKEKGILCYSFILTEVVWDDQ